MKKSVYLENVEKTIRNQIKWQKFESEIETQIFLTDIMGFIIKLYYQSLEKPEKQQK